MSSRSWMGYIYHGFQRAMTVLPGLFLGLLPLAVVVGALHYFVVDLGHMAYFKGLKYTVGIAGLLTLNLALFRLEAHRRGEMISWTMAITKMLRAGIRLLPINLVVAGLSILAFEIHLVLGFVALTLLPFIQVVFLLEGEGVLITLKRARSLVHGHFGTLLGLTFFLFVVMGIVQTSFRALRFGYLNLMSSLFTLEYILEWGIALCMVSVLYEFYTTRHGALSEATPGAESKALPAVAKDSE